MTAYRSGELLAATLSPRARKGAVIAAAGIMLLLGIALLPFLWYGQVREELAAQKVELALVMARTERSAGPAARITEADQPERMFLPGTTAGTTLASFQSLVNGAAARSGMSILRMQPLPSDEAAGAFPYRLAVDMSGGLLPLRTFLADIETGLPLMIVTSLEIVPRSAEDPYRSDDMAISLRLEAFGWRDSP